MSGTHTAGPWHMDGRMIAAKGGIAIGLICEFDDFGEIWDAPNAKPNGDLITAAPDMIAALQGLETILARAESNASGNPEWEAVSGRINAARAAIAKATGAA